MGICEKLKQEYLNELTELITECKKNSRKLRQEDSNDEAILENIKGNVYDIFYKMFNISYNNTCKNPEKQRENIIKLSKTYLAYFDKIPSAWKEKMTKDKEHNMMEEYYIEVIKLETVDEIKKLFTEYYDKFYLEA